jgi:nucleotide-binding universal stress UspA family protein
MIYFGIDLLGNQILNYTEKCDVDLIVMGKKGIKGIEKLLIGSLAENVIRHSKVPIMIVR